MGWSQFYRIAALGAEAEAAFLPTDVTSATAELWWSMQDSATLFQDSGFSVPAGGGDVVGGILDKSTKSRNGTQSTTAAKAILHTGIAGLNGQSILRFDGADDFYSLASTFTGLTASETFLVIKVPVAIPVAANGLWDIGAQVGATNYPDNSGDIRDSFGSTARRTFTPGINVTQYHIYNVVTTSSEWTARLNNNVDFTTAINTVGWEAVAAKIGVNGALFMSSDIAEWIVYDGKLSDIDHANVNNYLAELYGITSP